MRYPNESRFDPAERVRHASDDVVQFVPFVALDPVACFEDGQPIPLCSWEWAVGDMGRSPSPEKAAASKAHLDLVLTGFHPQAATRFIVSMLGDFV